jgi:hypothetical protein
MRHHATPALFHRSCSRPIICCFLLALLAAAVLPGPAGGGVARAAGTWYVAPDGADANNCMAPATACKTIGAAVGKAASGDTIEIAAGTYSENVDVIGKNLALHGAGLAVSRLDGGGLYTSAALDVSDFSIVNGEGVFVEVGGSLTLLRVNIQHNRNGVGAGINNYGRLKATQALIRGNVATISAGGGLWNRGGARADLLNVVISGNTAKLDGGGIMNTGVLSMTNVTVSTNVVSDTAGPASEGEGGGIYNDGTLTLINGNVSGNTAAYGGGGLANAGSATLRQVTISENTAEVGGGIDNFNAFFGTPTLTMTNVTLSGNAATTAGGGMTNLNATATLTNVTVLSNTAAQGSALYVDGTTRLRNTIIASDAPAGNCVVQNQALISRGHNLENGSSCGLAGAGDRKNANPRLRPLANNGGFAPTHAPEANSPAIDAGDNAGCPATDARGVARPTDGNGDHVAVCDIGAVEVVPLPVAAFIPLVRD